MMGKQALNSAEHHRKSIRLKNFDYTHSGAYFVTICTNQRVSLFGKVVDGIMLLNEFGRIVSAHWEKLPMDFENVNLDVWVVMPNHFHGIIILNDLGKGEASENGRPRSNQIHDASPLHPIGTVSRSLGAVIQNFKSITTRKINILQGSSGRTVWQRNYYEHIIRNEQAFSKITTYIQNNPVHWELDKHFIP